MAEPDTPLPWVLIRKGKKQLRFATLELGQKFYAMLIYGRDGWKEPEGALFGPHRQAWYRKGRHGSWARDDDRRRREKVPEDEVSA